MTPRATYRLQLHDGFTFADAQALVPYLDALGISHVYASPITVAAAGSTHGYDVVDPTRIAPALGGEAGFRALVAALRARGMGVVLDIVPNHMGIAGGQNRWWEDVLRRGRDGAGARFFDIDRGFPVVLPVLDDALPAAIAAGEVRLERAGGRWCVVAGGGARFPVRDEDQAGLAPDADVAALLDRQHYRLVPARAADDEVNWRRFFTVNDLAAVRVEDPAVFEATHALYLRLYAEELIDGVRIDHVDGLTDPAGYLRGLRGRLDAIRPGGWIVAEKILAAGEPLAHDWGVDGTSGYDFMEEVGGLLHDPAGEAPLGALWHAIGGRTAAFPAEELRARRETLSWSFEGQLSACVAAFDALARSGARAGEVTRGMLRRAIERMLWVFPVYRTYGTGDGAPARDAAVRDAVRARVVPHLAPGEAWVVDLVLSWLAGTGPGDRPLAAEAVRRFQQLSAPIAAKAVEDTAFYRYARLLSRGEVGAHPGRFAPAIADFHAAMAGRARDFPRAMLATATHDHKRGEDARARLAVLSGVADVWEAAVARWLPLAAGAAAGVDAADLYMLFQTMVGAWPDGLGAHDGAGLDAYAARLAGWQRKALREAKLRSSWPAPDAAYEARCADGVRAMLDPARSAALIGEVAALVDRTAAATLANTLAQVALRCTVPGVPDCFQGTEIADRSLVDPDNRRPVDYDCRRRLLAAGGDPKLALLARLLALRRAAPALFADGDYRPVAATGPRADRLVAFERRAGGMRLRVAVAVRCARPLLDARSPAPARGWWADTATHDGIRAADLLADDPVWVAID